jgi:hypothetical protein
MAADPLRIEAVQATPALGSVEVVDLGHHHVRNADRELSLLEFLRGVVHVKFAPESIPNLGVGGKGEALSINTTLFAHRPPPIIRTQIDGPAAAFGAGLERKRRIRRRLAPEG